MSGAATLAKNTVTTSVDTGNPEFGVELVRRVGVGLTALTVRYDFTGSYRQCRDEIDRAQQQNRRIGRWDLGTLLPGNRAALAANDTARADLARRAARAFGHPCAWVPASDAATTAA